MLLPQAIYEAAQLEVLSIEQTEPSGEKSSCQNDFTQEVHSFSMVVQPKVSSVLEVQK